MTFNANLMGQVLLHPSNAASQQSVDVSHGSPEGFMQIDLRTFAQILTLGLIVQDPITLY